MTDTRAARILDRAQALASGRSNFDAMFQAIAERALPASANFNVQRAPGEERTEKMLDATAALALRKFATILEAMSMPRNQKWHRLVPADQALRNNRNVRVYMDSLNDILFRYRYAPSANFTGQSGAMLLEGGAFGTASMLIDDFSSSTDETEKGYGLRYRALPLVETYFVENHVGIVDQMYRRYRWTAENAVKRWGDKLPEEIKRAAQNSPDQMFSFVLCLRPLTEANPREGILRDMRFEAYTASETGKVIVQSGGYYTWPLSLFRDLTAANEVYGRSPGTWVLPDMRMLNEMNRSIIRQAQKAVDPPIMTTEDGALEPFDMRPGRPNPGTLSSTGEPLVKPFESTARFDVAFEMLEEKRQTINAAYFTDLLSIVVDKPNMTATEVLERAQEKGMLLGPLSGRIDSECLGPLVHRELDLHWRAGRLPPMPDELLEAGGQYLIEYENPLARAQRAEEGVAIQRTMEAVTPLAALDPSVMDNFDLDATARTLSEVYGMQSKLLNDPAQVEAIREQRAQQQAAAAAAGAAPGIGKAVKDVAQAAALQ